MKPLHNFYYPLGAYARDTQAQIRNELRLVQPEAFCLMNYASSDGRVREQLWNSRDGVTPFNIHTSAGVQMQHVDWQMDVCVPFFVPPVGMRVFVDITEAVLREHMTRQVETYWDDDEFPMSDRWDTKEEAISEFVVANMKQPGQPDIVVVTPELQAQFAARASERLPVFTNSREVITNQGI